jgi:putative transcription factor
MLVCGRCQRLGTPYEEDPITVRQPVRKALTFGVTRRKAPELPKGMEESELAEDYPDRVRKHRMKLGLSQEDLAKLVKEKLSVIQKIETGKMTPDTKLCRELEHELKVKLLVPRKETPAAPKSTTPTEVTLGDIIRIKGKSKSELSV